MTPAAVPSPTRERAHRAGQLVDERVVDLVLREEAVGADAGLAHVAELRGERALDRGVEIGVVEDDERRVAAQLQPDLLHRAGGLAHQELADFGRAGEADEAHRRMLAHRLADRRRAAGEQVEDAGGHPGALRQFAEGERGERRGVGGLDHRRAADRDRRRHLAGDHRGGEVPRRDRRDDADRLLDHENARIGAEGRVDLAVDALGLLGEELDERGGVVDLAARFGERLALLAGHDQRDVVAIGDDELEPAPEDRAALLGGAPGPGRKGARRRFDRVDGLRFAEARDFGDQRAGGGIVDGVDAFADPFAVD